MSATSKEATPPGDAQRHLGWALTLICVAQLMVVLDGTIANIALPFIGRDLAISQGNLTWIVTAYALAFGGLLLLGGRLGDLYGRRRIFMIGLIVFAVASLLGGLAQNEAMLLGSRGLQGFGAAMASPAALALITTTFPAGPRRNSAFGVYAMMSGVGAAVGLILGGWLTGLDSVFGLGIDGWRMTFLINVPIGLVAAALAPRVLAESERHRGELDIPGAVTATLGLLAIVFGLSRAGEADYGWSSGQTVIPLVLGVLSLVAFIVIETRVEHPLLPLRIFQNRTRATSFAVMLIVPAAMFAMFFFLSLVVQQLMGYSPLHTGFSFLPFSLGIVAGATLTSKLIAMLPPRVIAGVGTLMAAVALFGFSRISVDDSPEHVLSQLALGKTAGTDVSYWAHIFPWIVLMAFGMGMIFVVLTQTAVHHLRDEDSGVGSAVLNTAQQVGGALGLAVLSTVSLHFINNRSETVAGPLQAGLTNAGIDPNALVPGTDTTNFGAAMLQATFAEGATHAFLVGSCLMLAASAIVWTSLKLNKEELATDGPAAAAHVG